MHPLGVEMGRFEMQAKTWYLKRPVAAADSAAIVEHSDLDENSAELQ